MSGARSKIYDIFREEFNAKKLKGVDLLRLFQLYDKFVFGGDISTILKESESVLEFEIHNNKIGSVADHGSQPREGDGVLYFIKVSPYVIIRRAEHIKMDILTYLLYVFEIELMNVLIMIMWRHIYKVEPNPQITIFSESGALHKCMMKTYFGDIEVHQDIMSRKQAKQMEVPQKLGLLKWSSNSCYVDGLLMIILWGNSPWWRSKILNFDTRVQEYNPVAICSKDALVKTSDEVRQLAEKIRIQLFSDYNAIVKEQKSKTCWEFRQEIWKCIRNPHDYPTPRSYGNPADIYFTLVGLFPSLNILNVPTEVFSGGKRVGMQFKNRAMYEMWDFMDAADTIQPGGGLERVHWDKVTAPTLVFSNLGQVTIMNSTEDEYVIHKGYGRKEVSDEEDDEESEEDEVEEDDESEVEDDESEGESEDEVEEDDESDDGLEEDVGRHEVYKKARAFGEYIIHNNYRLVGVITLIGVSPGMSGGSHYVCHFRIGDTWFYYDDIGPTLRRVEKLPNVDGVWVERSGRKPAMYFYERVK